MAEIKDEGIVLNQPLVDHCKRQVSRVNGSMVRFLIPWMGNLSESFDFMNEYSRTDLIAFYNTGLDFSITNSKQELISPKVNVGDSFSGKNGDNYYLIFIMEANEIG